MNKVIKLLLALTIFSLLPETTVNAYWRGHHGWYGRHGWNRGYGYRSGFGLSLGLGSPYYRGYYGRPYYRRPYYRTPLIP